MGFSHITAISVTIRPTCLPTAAPLSPLAIQYLEDPLPRPPPCCQSPGGVETETGRAGTDRPSISVLSSSTPTDQARQPANINNKQAHPSLSFQIYHQSRALPPGSPVHLTYLACVNARPQRSTTQTRPVNPNNTPTRPHSSVTLWSPGACYKSLSHAPDMPHAGCERRTSRRKGIGTGCGEW